MAIILLVLVACCTFLVSAQTPTPECDYQQDLLPGQTYYVYSPGYPKNYPANRYCRWFARAPTSYKINITCTVNLPFSQSCANDTLLVSQTGNVNDFHTYCGSGEFTLLSEGNTLLTELRVPSTTVGGTFSCTLFVTTPPPPPVCECGWKTRSRIVNGQETGVNEYPMMAGIADTLIDELICGGSIISNRYILTAAHCLVNRLPKNIVILIGYHNIAAGGGSSAAKQMNAETFIGHPNYDSTSQVNDIALIRVVGYIYFSMQVGPACLPFRNSDSPNIGQQVTVLGWGTLEQAGEKSNVLMKTALDVVNITVCQSSFGSSRVSQNQICTFRRGTDACQADSGGPVIFERSDNRIWLQGIISYGKGCAIQYPGVNTRVGKYLPWILQSTPDASYCVL